VVEHARVIVGPLATNCWILKSGEELAIVDPGGDAPDIVAKARELGGTVKYVINTHGHIDHVAANRPVLDEMGGELVISHEDEPMLLHPDPNFLLMMGLKLEPEVPDRTVREGDVVELGDEKFKVMETPGHTPGSICLVGSTVCLSGDTLFLDSIGRTDFPGGSEAQMRESLQRLRLCLDKELELLPGHNEPGSFARALLVNPFLGGGWGLG
jgi:hydroxyacylglutathione hydrolase